MFFTTLLLFISRARAYDTAHYVHLTARRKHAGRKAIMFEQYNFNYYETRHEDLLRETEHRRAIAAFDAPASRLSLLARRAAAWMSRRAIEGAEESPNTATIYTTAALRRTEQIR
jgi:hypothetical protein